MSTVYLNQELRSEIIKAALKKAGYMKKLDELNRLFSDWAERVRKHLLPYPDDQLKKWDAMIARAYGKVPEGIRPSWSLAKSDELRIRIRGNLETLYFRTDHALDPLSYRSGARQFRERRYTCGIDCEKLTDPKLVSEYEGLLSHKQKYWAERDALAAEIEGAMHGCRTVQKLLKQWPEAKSLIPDTAKPTSTALAIPLADLNAKIGLP